MGDFRQSGGNRSGGGGHGGSFGRQGGGRPSFPRRNWSGSDGRGSGPVTMHQAICNQCGKPCEVPFRPTEGKPVYCNACFGGKKETGNNRGGDRFPQKSFSSYSPPTRTDFESNINKGNNDEMKKQLEILNVKMDRLIKAVETIANTKPLAIEEKTKEAVKMAPAVKIKKLAKKVSGK